MTDEHEALEKDLSGGAGKKSAAIALIVSAVIGAFFFLYVYSDRVLSPASTAWLMNASDALRFHYFGGVFYRESPWLSPAGMMDALSYPHPSSVLNTDSIPILALPFKLLSPILPAQHQYFGIWGLACFMLQSVFGAAICLRFTRSALVAILGGILFLISPVMIEKTFYHTSLSGHWLILFGLLLLLDHARLSERRAFSFFVWALLGALSAGVQQYFVAMCGVICIGYCLYEFLQNKRWYGFLPLAFFALGSALVYYLLGAFHAPLRLESGGLGESSFNLNGFVDPQGYSRILPDLQHFPPQAEGLAYLGFGVITLCVICCVILAERYVFAKKREEYVFEKTDPKAPFTPDMIREAPKSSERMHTLAKDRAKHQVDIIVYGVLCLLFIAFALSPVITFGRHVLFSVDVPQNVREAIGIFSSTGRFIWPVVYIITTLAVFTLLRTQRTGVALCLLCLCAALQYYDLSKVFGFRYSHFSKDFTFSTNLSQRFWDGLGESKAIKRVVVDNDLAGNMEFMKDFSWFAGKYGWNFNNHYLSRMDREGGETCREALKNPADDTLFLLGSTEYPEIAAFAGDRIEFRSVDGVAVGTANRELAAAPAFSALPDGGLGTYLKYDENKEFHHDRLAGDTVLGERNQLFSKESINEFFGLRNRYRQVTDEYLQEQAKRFAAIEKELRARDIGFSVVLTPSKASVYRDDIPLSYVTALRGGVDRNFVRPYTRFRNALDQAGATYVDSETVLAEKGVSDKFAPTSSHWSKLASLAVTGTLLDLYEKQTGHEVRKLKTVRVEESKEPVPYFIFQNEKSFDANLLSDYVREKLNYDASGVTYYIPVVETANTDAPKLTNVYLHGTNEFLTDVEYWLASNPAEKEENRVADARQFYGNNDVVNDWERFLNDAAYVVFEVNEETVYNMDGEADDAGNPTEGFHFVRSLYEHLTKE